MDTHGEGDVTVFHGLSDQVSTLSWYMGVLDNDADTCQRNHRMSRDGGVTDLFAEHKRHFTLAVHISLLDFDQGIV